MARVREAEVREYQLMCELTETRAKDELLAALSNLDVADESSWPYVVELVTRLYSDYGRAFAELGRQFYQWCRDVQTGGEGTFVAETFWDDRGYGLLTNAVNGHLQDLSDDRKTEGEATTAIANSLGNFAFKASRDSIQHNLNEEWKARVAPATNGRLGFARVPRAGCTCAFCIMMASRGFVYHTRETAGGGDPANRYHLNCRCAVVPMDASDSTIAGYDESGYLDLYETARDALNANSLPREVYERIARAQARAEREGRTFKEINAVEIAMRHMHGLH